MTMAHSSIVNSSLFSLKEDSNVMVVFAAQEPMVNCCSLLRTVPWPWINGLRVGFALLSSLDIHPVLQEWQTRFVVVDANSVAVQLIVLIPSSLATWRANSGIGRDSLNCTASSPGSLIQSGKRCSYESAGAEQKMHRRVVTWLFMGQEE